MSQQIFYKVCEKRVGGGGQLCRTTTSMRKIIFHLEIQQISMMHKTPHPFFDHTHPKVYEVTFNFLEFVSRCKKSVYSINSFLKYCQF